MADEALAAFMDVTGCGYDDAFHRLASCGGHLGKAVNRFFNADAGTSGTTRRSSPPPSPQLISSDDSDSDPEYDGGAAARALVPARRRARGGGAKGGGGARERSPPSAGSSPSVSRSDRDTARGGSSRRRGLREGKAGGDRGRVEKKRRIAEDDEPRGGCKGSRRRRRQFRVDMFASISDEEEEKVEKAANNGRRQRRRLNPKAGGASAGDEEVQVTTSRTRRPNRGNNRYPESIFTFGSDDDMELAEAAPPAPASKSDRDALFRTPHGLAYKCGSLHGAKAQAARRRRWLLVNVQGLDMASLAQNRDVWGSDLVAQCVRDHFVLWQADAGAVDGGGEVEGDEEEQEARTVLCYYKVPLDRLPVVVVVDPVTGEAVDRIHGTDPNDFLVSIGPYTDKKPEFPVAGAAKKPPPASASAQQSNQKPPPAATTAPTSRKEQAPAVRKPAEPPAAAPAIGEQPATGEKVCKMRVRLPDGRVVAQEFGSQCAVAALFAYCRSELGAEKPLRLLHFVGASREAIGDENASFESLGLHMSTVCVHLG